MSANLVLPLSNQQTTHYETVSVIFWAVDQIYEF